MASFDSATGMLRALARYLSGQDVPAIGQVPRALEPVLSGVLGGINRLPKGLADRVYAASGIVEAVPRTQLGDIESEALAAWVAGHYPKRQYPVIFIGSTNGALIHLAAAMDAPWLPQTLLIPVHRRGVDRDDPRAELRAGLDPGRELLDANPSLVLHHMHDPNQDRLMSAGMSYFRVKWRELPNAYRKFVLDHLAPGGAVISVECELPWPVTRVHDRHRFQFGALGGATADEYREGGHRVAALLDRYGATRRRWDPPAADAEAPEAEWGFEPALLESLDDLTRQHGVPLHRLRFDHPEKLSTVVADLHRQWYANRGLPTSRLLAECFLLMEPWWTLRTGSVPFWMAFNTRESHRALNSYLDEREPYDEIRLLLFSHGAESIGLASAREWRELVNRARIVGGLTGVDPDAYPRDFATLVRAHRELTRTRPLHAMPSPLTTSQVEPMLRDRGEVTWQPAR